MWNDLMVLKKDLQHDLNVVRAAESGDCIYCQWECIEMMQIVRKKVVPAKTNRMVGEEIIMITISKGCKNSSI